MKILLSAKQRGSTNALAPIAQELIQRRHATTIYATGNDSEVAGFGNLEINRVNVNEDNCRALVRGYDAVVVGLSGFNTPDGYFLRATNKDKIPVVAIQDQNSAYQDRLGTNPADLPTILAVMDEDCRETARKELGDEAAKRCQVIGWTAFDSYAKLREDFTEQRREELLNKLGLNPEELVYFHATQNIHPNSTYMKRSVSPDNEKIKGFLYECKVTQFTFEAASDLGVKLIIKPHPGEEFEQNFTEELTLKHGFIYLLSKSCNTQELILASYSVTAGRSTCLTEATLLDKNTGAILPDIAGKEWSSASPAVALNAIPVTYHWNGIRGILEGVTTLNKTVQQRLAEDRKRFSVDGKASQRLVDLIEEL
ncbi:MAG: hypothetical protein Q8Q01_02095 [archaeon]|nr:hypothetical protein [archaeon]